MINIKQISKVHENTIQIDNKRKKNNPKPHFFVWKFMTAQITNEFL